MIGSWLESIEQQGEPVIWTWVTNMLKKHGILTCSLAGC